MAGSKKLQWDQTGERLYETGTDHGVLYRQAADGTYPKGVAWNGLTGFTESPEGAEANAIYADNIKYLNLRGAEDYGATITAYTYPEEFEECNGRKNAAAGVFFGQQPRAAFGFSCRTLVGNDVEGDQHGYKLHLVYGCTASPSEMAYQTVNDSPEAIEFSWDIDTIPCGTVPEGFKPTAAVTIDTTLLNLEYNKETGEPTSKDARNLKALEDKLYGVDPVAGGADGSDPYLPLPTEVVETMTAA